MLKCKKAARRAAFLRSYTLQDDNVQSQENQQQNQAEVPENIVGTEHVLNLLRILSILRPGQLQRTLFAPVIHHFLKCLGVHFLNPAVGGPAERENRQTQNHTEQYEKAHQTIFTAVVLKCAVRPAENQQCAANGNEIVPPRAGNIAELKFIIHEFSFPSCIAFVVDARIISQTV